MPWAFSAFDGFAEQRDQCVAIVLEDGIAPPAGSAATVALTDIAARPS